MRWKFPMYKIGDIVKGKVTGIENYGIFLLMEDGYTGLIHISEISEKLGFNALHYFSRLFKSRGGVSPTEYLKASDNDLFEQ